MSRESVQSFLAEHAPDLAIIDHGRRQRLCIFSAGDRVRTIEDFVRFSARLRVAMGPNIVDMLRQGLSVVLDFPANTVMYRNWIRSLITQTEAAHELYLLDFSDTICKQRLRQRNAEGEHPLPSERSSGYVPDLVASICWIKDAQIEEAARLIWHARPVSYYAWSGHEQHANVTQTARAMSLLYALTGCFDAKGGDVLLPALATAPINVAPAAPRQASVVGLAEHPLGPAKAGNVTTRELRRAVMHGEPYPIRGLIGFGSNLVMAHAQANEIRETLSALDFFAQCDMFLTPTAPQADVVLPVASCFEREALKLGFEISTEAQSHIQFRQAVVPPPGEARGDTEIIFGIAEALGLGGQFWDGEIDAAYRHQLAPSGIRLEQLRAAPGGIHVDLDLRYAKYAETDANGTACGFATPSRKVELYCERFLDHGYPPLPAWEEPLVGPVARPDLAARFPLVLTCAKPALFLQTQFRAIPSLRGRAPDPEIDIHPEAAAARGISAGDWVSIETPDGRARARARLNAEIDSRVAVGEHGWWQACAALDATGYDPFGQEGVNFNNLIGTAVLDPVCQIASKSDPFSLPIVTPLAGADVALCWAVCDWDGAVGKWPAGATVESLA